MGYIMNKNHSCSSPKKKNHSCNNTPVTCWISSSVQFFLEYTKIIHKNHSCNNIILLCLNFVVLFLSLLLVNLHRTVFCLSCCAFGGFTQVCIDTAKKIMCLSFMSIMTQKSCVVT